MNMGVCRTMLADRLMSKSDYDTDRELHTLELLKLRFGDTSLHDCEIMLKVSAPLSPGGRCDVVWTIGWQAE